MICACFVPALAADASLFVRTTAPVCTATPAISHTVFFRRRPTPAFSGSFFRPDPPATVQSSRAFCRLARRLARHPARPCVRRDSRTGRTTFIIHNNARRSQTAALFYICICIHGRSPADCLFARCIARCICESYAPTHGLFHTSFVCAHVQQSPLAKRFNLCLTRPSTNTARFFTPIALIFVLIRVLRAPRRRFARTRTRSKRRAVPSFSSNLINAFFTLTLSLSLSPQSDVSVLH